MSVVEIINHRDVGTLASLAFQQRETLCLSGPVRLAKGRENQTIICPYYVVIVRTKEAC